MPDNEPPLAILEPRSSLDMTYNTHGEPLRRYLAAAPGRAGSWLLSWIMPMYATFYTETQEELQKLGRSFTAALTAARALNYNRVVYALMVKTYPSEVCLTDTLTSATTGGTDSTAIAATHYARVYGFLLAWDTDNAFNFTDGSLNVTLGTDLLAKVDLTKTNQFDAVWISVPVPSAGQLGEDITMTIPQFDAGACKCRCTVYYNDVIGSPITE